MAKNVQRDIDKAIKEGMLPGLNSEVASYMLVGWLETAPLLLNEDMGYSVDDLLDTLDGIFISRR